MLTAKDISERLEREADRVCRYLLPGGKMDGGNWCVGSLAGEPGMSLRIQISGSKAGVWCDFASGAENAKGDLLDLWAAVKGVSLGAALKEAKSWLGINDPSATNPPKTYKRPTKRPGLTVIRPETDTETDVEKYLIHERKLSRETLTQFKIAQVDHSEIGRSIGYPSYSPAGEWLAAKYIALARDERGKKIIRNEKDQAPILFGWQAFPKGDRSVVLTEGQIDAMTWHQWGVAALSIPNGCAGGGHDNWIDFEWDNLLQFDTIYISFDMDHEGEASAAIVARRLGIHRCLIVKLPHNDANDCLQKGCDGAMAARWLIDAKPMAPKEIKSPIEFHDRIMEMENPDPNAVRPGLEFPVLGPRIRFLPGETTIWTGYSFHGKSTLLNQLALYAAHVGQKVAIGSFEMRGELTCAKLSRCLSMQVKIAPILKECLEWMSGKIWVFDVFGMIPQAKLRELMLYSIMRHGVKHFVIDSLMKCDVSSEDYEAQRKFLNELIGFAHEHEIHVHIVAHPRKSDTDEAAPDIMDIHGGQSVSGQPDNIISVWKNSKKSDKREDGKLTDKDEAQIPDAVSFIRKNRAMQDRFKVPMWFHRGCHRFTSVTDDQSVPYYHDFGVIQRKEENAACDNS